jgi:diadenosine tetraphosphate (Ap4A) HIT family hydrolase
MGESERKEVFRRHFDVKPERVLHQDEHVLAFWDRSPRAAVHVLVIPRFEALVGVESLTSQHLPLLAHMETVARRVTPAAGGEGGGAHGKNDSTDRRAGGEDEQLVLGFHRKPLRSVPFLHLHSIRPPFKPARNKLAFTKLPVGDLGYISLSDVVHMLGGTPQNQRSEQSAAATVF